MSSSIGFANITMCVAEKEKQQKAEDTKIVTTEREVKTVMNHCVHFSWSSAV